MDVNELLATIFAGLSLLGLMGFGFWWLIKYGIKEAKETHELRKLWKKWLEKHTDDNK